MSRALVLASAITAFDETLGCICTVIEDVAFITVYLRHVRGSPYLSVDYMSKIDGLDIHKTAREDCFL